VRLEALPSLSASEERALVLRFQAGDRDAAGRLVASQLRWLRREALRRARVAPRTSWEDLAAAGALAFLEALPSFDVDRGVRLWTHVRRPVEAAMAAEVAAWTGPMAVPGTSFRKTARAVRETGSDGAAASASAKATGRQAGATFEAVRAVKLWTSSEALAERIGGAGRVAGAVPVTWQAPRVQADPVVRLVVRLALQSLPVRQRRVLELTVSAEPGVRLSDVAAAEVLRVSRHTVARDRRVALMTLREVLGEDFREHLYVRPRARSRGPLDLAA
jgi:DNA-directed RNA polymerase specialized sigma subunit